MRLTADGLRHWENKRITLLGMSGVGKTRLATLLRRSQWFHYAGDYRIGTRYLDEAILDNIKSQAMQIPFLRELFRSDSIYICNNITVDNLKPLSTFLGKLGNPERGGLGLAEFKRRQSLHREAEIRAMKDVPDFIRKARDIYGYRHFVNDAGGSLCEIDDPEALRILAEHTLILYIQATAEDEAILIRRALADPKPLYYRETFLDEELDLFMRERGLPYIALVDPDDFVRFVFPRLFRSRIPRYEAIAVEYGYTVTTTELAGVASEADFLALLATVLERTPGTRLSMPLVANSELPAFAALRAEGETILPREAALHQDIRELHIGLLNMMPDAALAATERQFFRLVGESNQIAQFYVHPFTLAGLERDAEARAHIRQYYEDFEEIRSAGLDALIITGANVTQPDLALEPFWRPLIEVIDWAYDNVTSTLCSCLATHAVLQFRYGQKRRRLPDKRWGVYPHRITDRRHPLVMGINTRFDVPHSRYNQIDRGQFEAAGLTVLVESEAAGVHLAVSADGFRLVFLQAHPEYDTVSLLKEYKREVLRFAHRERDDYPPFPEDYFTPQVQAILGEYAETLHAARSNGKPIPEMPEELITPHLDNTWHDTAEAIVNNWVGKIYQVTHSDRRRPFMDGVDPEDPLGLRRR